MYHWFLCGLAEFPSDSGQSRTSALAQRPMVEDGQKRKFGAEIAPSESGASARRINV